MAISLTKTSGGVVLHDTSETADLLFETKLSSLTEGAASVTIDGMVNKKWTRKDIPVTNLSIDGVPFNGTAIALVKKLRDEVFTGEVPDSGNGGSPADLSDYFTKAEVTNLLSELIRP